MMPKELVKDGDLKYETTKSVCIKDNKEESEKDEDK